MPEDYILITLKTNRTRGGVYVVLGKKKQKQTLVRQGLLRKTLEESRS